MASSPSSKSPKTSSLCIESGSTSTDSTPAWVCPSRWTIGTCQTCFANQAFAWMRPGCAPVSQARQLVLGDVNETIGPFLASRPAPVGFVSVDVDLYSSTMSALKLFDGEAAALLPRVYLLLRRHSGRDIFRVHRRTTRDCRVQRGPLHAKDSADSRPAVFPAPAALNGGVAGTDVHCTLVRSRLVPGAMRERRMMSVAGPTCNQPDEHDDIRPVRVWHLPFPVISAPSQTSRPGVLPGVY